MKPHLLYAHQVYGAFFVSNTSILVQYQKKGLYNICSG